MFVFETFKYVCFLPILFRYPLHWNTGGERPGIDLLGIPVKTVEPTPLNYQCVGKGLSFTIRQCHLFSILIRTQ